MVMSSSAPTKVYKNVMQAQKLDLLGGMVHGVCNLPGFKQANLEGKLPIQSKTCSW